MRPVVIAPTPVVAGVAVPFDYANVDTDAIFPVSADAIARREGFGRALFARWREADPGFVLERPQYAEASILVAGPDFGVGSSRESAVWALTGAGFRAVIAPSFGDIFRSNCARNRLLAATLDSAACAELREELSARPGARVSIAVSEGRLTGPSGRVLEVGVGEFARACLVDGIDEYDLLARRRARIDEVLARREHLLRPTTRVARPEPSGEHG
jgi:3-isopropylmalate/(R)-2-methylmalate dehydratase small subunit